MAVNHMIVVCGDSFCTATTDQRSHFSQVLEDRFGYSVINLARSGMSTAGICFQIQEAIKFKPMAIIYAVTGPARLDIPINNRFKSQDGLRNFIYPFPGETATGHDLVGDKSAPILCHNISTFADLSDTAINQHLQTPLDPQVRQAVKMFATYLYDESLQSEIQSWIYDHWHHRIELNGILPIRFSRETFARIAYDFSDANPGWPRAWHTDDATQIQLAETLHEMLQDHR